MSEPPDTRTPENSGPLKVEICLSQIRIFYGLLLGSVSIIFFILYLLTSWLHFQISTVFALFRWGLIALLILSPIIMIFTTEIIRYSTLLTRYELSLPKLFKFHITAALCVMSLLLYFSTGTLSPYVNLLDQTYIIQSSAHNLYNGDYGQFTALYYLIDGKGIDSWGYSVVLRRILYNFLSYPLMKCIGHDTGGVLFNFILALTGVFIFSLFIYKTIGLNGAIAGTWLCSLFPGIAYFAGQPFLYGIIAPASLLIYLLLWKLLTVSTLREICFFSLLAGMACTGYDFLPFIIPAFCMSQLLTKRFFSIFPGLFLILLPLLIWWILLTFFLGGSFSSENSAVYTSIIASWFSGIDIRAWVVLLYKLPVVSLNVLLFSSFITLPVMTIIALVFSKGNFLLDRNHTIISGSLFASAVLLFFINNAVPPYQSLWQMRGDWIARLYEPVYVIYIIIIALSAQHIYAQSARYKKTVFSVLLIACFAFNTLVIAGPVLNDPFGISSTVYWRFYKHYKPENMKINLLTFGRKPIEFCK